MSNYDEIREKSGTVKRLSGAKAYIVVTWDGEGLPVIAFDLRACQEKKDLRHQCMQAIANRTVEAIGVARDVVEKAIAGDKEVTADEGKSATAIVLEELAKEVGNA
jgi:hypothetical protein